MSSKLINIGHGDPTIFRNWWTNNNFLPTIHTNVPSLYEYQEEDFQELSDITHKFHQLFGTDNPSSSIVYGNGSTQVINAILYTISKRFQRPIVVGYAPPVYMLMHEFLSHSPWIIVTFDLTRLDIDVEIVIDPNNPSGEHRTQQSSAPYAIFDRAYNWPIYVPLLSHTSSQSNHITVYTISKSLGMGGIRLGWAFLNDPQLSAEIQRSLFIIGICPNSFGMKVAKTVFSRFITDSSLLKEYREGLLNVINNRRKQLETCPDFIITNKYGPYAWIKSHDGTDIAQTLMNKYKIKVYSGDLFGSTTEYARLSLICSEEEFNSSMCRMTHLPF